VRGDDSLAHHAGASAKQKHVGVGGAAQVGPGRRRIALGGSELICPGAAVAKADLVLPGHNAGGVQADEGVQDVGGAGWGRRPTGRGTALESATAVAERPELAIEPGDAVEMLACDTQLALPVSAVRTGRDESILADGDKGSGSARRSEGNASQP